MPAIALESLEVITHPKGYDSIIELVISYADGDGDIGLGAEDKDPPFNYGSPFYHNLPVTYLVANSSGIYDEFKDNNGEPYGNQHERVPVLTPAGKYKAITGNITLKLIANPANTKLDSMKLRIALIDRALNVSNVIETQVIHLKH